MDEDLKRALNVLSDNQNIINTKIDSLLSLYADQINKTEMLQNKLYNYDYAFNNLSEKINNLSNKLSDIEINIQNSNDISEISSNINNISMEINELKQSLDRIVYYNNTVYD